MNLRARYQELRNHSLLRNSFFLMCSTIVLGGVGFLFWVVVARSFSTDTVGLATTLISISSLIALFGLGGFDTVFMRFLARAEDKSKVISTGLLVSALLSAALAICFVFLVPVISPEIAFIQSNPLYVLLFVATTALTTWNTIINAAFIAHRKGSYVLLTNSVFSIAKLGLPFVFSSNDPMLIFSIVGAAQLIYVSFGLGLMMRRLGYHPQLRINFETVRRTYRYSAAAYSSNLLNLLPDSILPILVLGSLGAHAAAYFYIAFTIANFLYAVAFMTTQATLAEAAHDTEHIGQHMRGGLKIIYGIMAPSILLLVILAPFVLGIFGTDYRTEASGLTVLFVLSGLLVALYAVLNTYFKATHQLAALITTTGIKAIAILGLAVMFISGQGLIGVGWAWLIGNALAVTAGGLYLLRPLRGTHKLGS